MKEAILLDFVQDILDACKESADKIEQLHSDISKHKEDIMSLIEAEKAQLVLAHHHMEIAKKNESERDFLLSIKHENQAIQFASECRTAAFHFDETMQQIETVSQKLKEAHERFFKILPYNKTATLCSQP